MADQKDFLAEGVGGPPADLLAATYRNASSARRLDAALHEEQRRGNVSFYVPSTGEEVVETAAAAAIEWDDAVFPGLRATGVYLQRGMPIETWVHQVFGTEKDPASGKGSPSFPAWNEGRVIPVSSSLGTHIAHGAGFAWAAKLDGKPLVSLVVFGDGSVSQPDFHTGLNFSGVFGAPAVFLWKSRGSAPAAGGSLQERAAAYGVDCQEIDGGDAAETWDAVTRAATSARKGGGPALLRACLPESFEVGEGSDPLVRLREVLEARGTWSVEQQEKFEQAIDLRIEAAIAEARSSVPPDRLTLFEQVYRRRPSHLVDQETEMLETIDGA